MIALRRQDGDAAEAALKYFVLGALASGLLLYGISLIYGATGSLQLADVFTASQQANPWLLKLGMIFVVVAIAFKLGAVPFHMWVPDVYQARLLQWQPWWVLHQKSQPLSLHSVFWLRAYSRNTKIGAAC